MDEKKVREAIYCMKSFADDTVCEECDNYDRCDHTMVANNARTAVEALQKQLPKKVEYEGGYIVNGFAKYRIAKCPDCDRWHSSRDEIIYCSKCGRKLDWSEEDE